MDSKTIIQSLFLNTKMPEWRDVKSHNSILFAYNVPSAAIPNSKVAIFSLDGTLLRNTREFTKITWLSDSVLLKLQELVANGYYLFITTNELKLGRKNITVGVIKLKMELVYTQLRLNCTILVSCYNDYYRKPSIGSFRYIQSLCEYPLTSENCFYCGDLCGCNGVTGVCDYNYAKNCNITYYTPTDLFDCPELLPKQPFSGTPKQFDPHILINNHYENLDTILKPCGSPEIVLLVGPPGCGKTYMCNHYFNSYTRVTQDALNSKNRCFRIATYAINHKKSVIVDNPNDTPIMRGEWVKYSKKRNVPIRVIIIEVSRDCCLHLNTFRTLGFTNDWRRLSVVSIQSFFTHYCEPAMSEGFSSIMKIPYVLRKFQSEEEKEAFFSFLAN